MVTVGFFVVLIGVEELHLITGKHGVKRTTRLNIRVDEEKKFNGHKDVAIVRITVKRAAYTERQGNSGSEEAQSELKAVHLSQESAIDMGRV